VSRLDPNVVAGTTGYLVADTRGRVVGRVERAAAQADADPMRLWVRGRFPFRRRRIVPMGAIQEIDQTSQVVLLNVTRESLHSQA
jgi:hypothetical protein